MTFWPSVLMVYIPGGRDIGQSVLSAISMWLGEEPFIPGMGSMTWS